MLVDDFIGLNWPYPHYCYQEWKKPDIEVMVVLLTYSANCLKTIGQKVHTVPNFYWFHLGNVIRSKIIHLESGKEGTIKCTGDLDVEGEFSITFTP